MIGLLNKLLQSLLPHHLMCRLMYAITRIKQPVIKNFFIQRFISMYEIDMRRYARKIPEEFIHFNDFFTRELASKENLPSSKTIYSPADGFISEYGSIQQNSLLQAKNIHYRVNDLLALNKQSTPFDDGQYMTIYLSPKNYHRIHCPLDAKLTEMIFVPGRLFGVGNLTRTTLDGLYVKNERLIMQFDSELGRYAVIMIGAIFVGSMETVWQGVITPNQDKQIQHWKYSDNHHYDFRAGVEIARFNMGSTVILLFEKDMFQWQSLEPQQAVLMGTPLAQCRNTN